MWRVWEGWLPPGVPAAASNLPTSAPCRPLLPLTPCAAALEASHPHPIAPCPAPWPLCCPPPQDVCICRPSLQQLPWHLRQDPRPLSSCSGASAALSECCFFCEALSTSAQTSTHCLEPALSSASSLLLDMAPAALGPLRGIPSSVAEPNLSPSVPSTWVSARVPFPPSSATTTSSTDRNADLHQTQTLPTPALALRTWLTPTFLPWNLHTLSQLPLCSPCFQHHIFPLGRVPSRDPALPWCPLQGASKVSRVQSCVKKVVLGTERSADTCLCCAGARGMGRGGETNRVAAPRPGLSLGKRDGSLNRSGQTGGGVVFRAELPPTCCPMDYAFQGPAFAPHSVLVPSASLAQS